MNAYFQIGSRDGKCIINLYPATDGGERINREEILEYLSIKNISYDIKQLGLALNEPDKPHQITTNTDFKFADSEFVKVTIAPDNMSATARFIAGYEGSTPMSGVEFLRELTSRGIIKGILNSDIQDFLTHREYCKDIVVAKGLPPEQGKDAVIEYFFNTDLRVRPTLKEDGTVDFFNLNTMNHCKEGDLLARLTPAIPGKVGINVKGERIKPREVHSAVLRYGHYIRINDEKTEIYSEVSGHVALVDNKVFVSNIYEVENVDNSVGNIDYEGSVRVNGNVCENFKIKAAGNVEIRGAVEGATIEAGGNITVALGVKGMFKGELKAGGNIICKFVENSKITAEGYVEAESLIHSTVSAGTDVVVNGRKGFISGGRISATNSVSVKNLGAEMGADTIVEVGMDTTSKKKIQALQKEIADINRQLDAIRPVLEGTKKKLALGIKMNAAQLLQIKKLAETNKECNERMAECVAELNELQNQTDNETFGQVIVTGNVYPGTKICIGDVSMVVKNSMKYCRFIKENGDVKMAPIY